MPPLHGARRPLRCLLPLVGVIIALLGVALLGSACAEPTLEEQRQAAPALAATAAPSTAPSAPTTTLPGPSPSPPPGVSGWSARVTNPAGVAAHPLPDASTEPSATFPAVNEFGDPYTFRVWEERAGRGGRRWYRAQLPVRPNGTEGWIPAGDVVLTTHRLRLVVDPAAHDMTLFDGPDPVRSWQVGVGQPATPTPRGSYYLWTKWGQNVNPVYGRGVLGLSSYSDAPNWPGDARIGIHGTHRPRDLGHDVSNGCVRMDNAALTEAWDSFPLGMPVDVL